MQATIRSYDSATGSGTAFLDDGTVLDFGPDTLRGSVLRLVRPGQRVAIHQDATGAITALTLITLPLPGA